MEFLSNTPTDAFLMIKSIDRKMTQKGLPLILDTVKTISTAIITAAVEGVVNSIIKNGGQV